MARQDEDILQGRQAAGFSPASDSTEKKPEKKQISPANIYPQGSPAAGANVYGGVGLDGLGSDSQSAQSTPRVAGAPGVVHSGNSYTAAPAQPAAQPQPQGFTYADNNRAVGQDIKDSWAKGNYGEAAGKTVAGTVGMFSTPIIDGASAAVDGAKGFGRGLFGMEANAAPAPAAPATKSTPKPEAASQAPTAATAAPTAPATTAPQDAATSVAADTQGQATRNLQQRLDAKGREGMTNAEVGQANPGGVVTMKRQANGVMEFSGNDVKGPVSYADEQGNAVAGAGIRGKGFGSVTTLPAGSAPASGASLGFLPERSGADALIRAGASAEQAAQYTNEVQRAQATNAMQQQLIASRKPEGTVMNGLMERTPGQQRRDAEVQASSIHAPTAALGKQALAAVNAAEDGRTRANTAKYAADTSAGASMYQSDNQLAAATMREAGETQREAGRNAIQQGELGLKREAQGFTSRAAAQQEQLRNVLLDPDATPEQRSIAQRNLAALSGKTAADRMQTVNLPDTTNDLGAVVKGGQALVRVRDDGTVEQVPISGQAVAAQPATTQAKANVAAAPKAGEVRNGYRFNGGNPNDKANWVKV